nr:peroxidase 20 [Tanacetum cinerariifolium]
MISGIDLHQFDVHNDGYFAYLPLNCVDGVILEMVVPRMSYEQLAEFLKEKCGCYFQGPLKRRYCNDFSVNEMVDWAEIEVETEGVEARNSNTESVEAKNSSTEGVKAKTRTKEKGKENL